MSFTFYYGPWTSSYLETIDTCAHVNYNTTGRNRRDIQWFNIHTIQATVSNLLLATRECWSIFFQRFHCVKRQLKWKSNAVRATKAQKEINKKSVIIMLFYSKFLDMKEEEWIGCTIKNVRKLVFRSFHLPNHFLFLFSLLIFTVQSLSEPFPNCFKI